MKTQIKRFSRTTLSVILTLCMLVSCMTVGLIATDAAGFTGASVGAKADETVSAKADDAVAAKADAAVAAKADDAVAAKADAAVAAKADDAVAAQAEETVGADKTIYIGTANWGDDESTVAYYAWAWTGNNEGAWYTFTKVTDHYYSISVPESTDGYIFFRAKNDMGHGWYEGTNYWNKTGNVNGESGKDCYTFSGYSTGTWGTYDSTGGGGDATESDYHIAWGQSDASQDNDVTLYNSDGAITTIDSNDIEIPSGNFFFYVKKNGNRQWTSKSEVSVALSSGTENYINLAANDGYKRDRYGNYFALISRKNAGAGLKYRFSYNTSTKTVTISYINPATSNIEVANDSIGTVTVSCDDTTITEGNTEALRQGATATITVDTGNSIKKAVSATVGTDSVTLTAASSSVYGGTFTVPSSDATVTVTYEDKTTYNVKYASADTAKGTVTATVENNTDVIEGTEVTYTATPASGYVFTGWEGTYTDSTAKITKAVTSAVDLTANFGKVGYKLVIENTETDMVQQSNGYFVSTNKVGNNYWFLIKNSATAKYSKTALTVKSSTRSTIKDWGSKNWDESHILKASTSGERYVVFDPATNKVWLSAYSDGISSVRVIAKDGTIRQKDNNWKDDVTSTFGKTTLTVNTPSGVTVNDAWYSNDANRAQEAEFTAEQVRGGIKITVSTNVTKNGYFVKGFCVNGGETQSVIFQKFDDNGNKITKSGNVMFVDAKGNDHEGVNNSFTLTIDSYTESVIEITPIYFKVEDESGDNVRFYVTNFTDEVKSNWGNTLACFGYTSSANVYGGWPGQPMVYEGGRYYMDMPREGIKGIALSNYVYDNCHSNSFYGDYSYNTMNGNQYQSYDYNDFVKIAAIQEVIDNDEDIIFSFKYKTGGNNFGSANKDSDYPDTINLSDYSEWEDLTDFYGSRVDICENLIDEEGTKASYNPLRIVSQGYDENTVGNFATAWIIYKPNTYTGTATSYTKVAVVSADSESALLDELAKTTYAEYLGIPAKISYEYAIYQKYGNKGSPSGTEGQPAERADGRWYVSRDTEINGHTVIEYGDSVNGPFVRDYYQENGVDYTSDSYDKTKNTGLVTGAKAYFTNTDRNNKLGETEVKTRSDGDSQYSLLATNTSSEYKFIGWYLYAEGEYTFITDEFAHNSEARNNDVFVARYVKKPAGEIEITHQVHPDSLGYGDCYVTVDVLENGQSIFTYDERQGGRTIGENFIIKDANRSLNVTLRTEPHEGSYFDDFYMTLENTLTQRGIVKNLTVDKDNCTATFTIDVDDLFSGDTINPAYKTIPYYSMLSLEKIPYLIEYQFVTRLYGTRIYRVTGDVTQSEITKYFADDFALNERVTQLTKQFVHDKTPMESNFRQDLEFKDDNIVLGVGGVATATKSYKGKNCLYAKVVATQTDKNTVTAYFDAYGISQDPITVTVGKLFLKDDGEYVTALPKNGDDEEFSYWSICSKRNDDAQVAICTNRKFFYSGYEDYHVIAIYGKGKPKDIFDSACDTTVSLMDVTRNHWNDTTDGVDISSQGKYGKADTDIDRLYVDFAVAFNYNEVLLSTTQDEVGLKLQKWVADSSYDQGGYWDEDNEITVKIPNSLIDNKNRLHYYVGIANTEENRTIWRAKSYMKCGSNPESEWAEFDLETIGSAPSMYE